MMLHYIFILLLNLQVTFISDSKQILVNHQLINNTIYISVDNLPQIICPTFNYEVENGIIYSSNFTLKTAPNSFYIVFSNDDSLRVGQMTLPAISKNNKILIPIYSFLNVMKVLNLIDYYFNDNSLFITKNIIKNKPPAIPEKSLHINQTNKEKFFEDSIIIPDIIINYDSTVKKIPNYYEVPKNIKRKGIK